MIFSADIEDWQQSVLDFDHPISERVLYNTQRLLAVLDEHHITGTFFVQGMVAERFPQLIRDIADAGHELASHAHSHRPLFTLTPEAFQEEVIRSVSALEQISGQKVLGFRAPTFSVQHAMVEWYCEGLKQAGIRYESSIVLVKANVGLGIHTDYGFSDASIVDAIKAQGIDCYPMTVGDLLFKKRIPVMGGGYFRLFPYWFTRWVARNIDSQHSVFYMHPHELDTREYAELRKIHHINLKTALHQFSRRSSVAGKLTKLFRDYPFQSFAQQYYADSALTPSS